MTTEILTEITMESTTFFEGIQRLDEYSDGWNTTDNNNLMFTSTSLLDEDSGANLSSSSPLSPLMVSKALFIPEADVKLFSHVTRSFVNPLLCLLGFVGNSLGIGVLWRQAKQQKLSIFWYLCALTLTDIIFLGLGVIDSIPRVVQAFDLPLAKYLMAHFRLGLGYFDNTFLHSARFIVLLMSCERLISVVKPLHVKDTWFAKYPVRLLVGCILFNAVFALPILINATVATRHVRNTTEYIFTFRHYNIFMAQFWVAEAIVHSFIPTILLIIINVAIPIQLYRASSKLSTALHKDASSQQGKVTTTVLAITIMYIFLSVPLIVVKILQYVDPDFNMNGRFRTFFWFLADLGKCLAYVNAANDFLVYFIVSNNYRAVFKAMYCKRFSRVSRIQRTYQSTGKVIGSRETMSTSVSG